MRRSRGGNAGKQKRQMNDDTFLSVIGGESQSAGPTAGSSATAVQDADPDMDTALAYLAPVRAQEQGLAPINGFVFSCYVLGTITCSGCHCELMYYQDREILRQGFAFRCRVCQSMQTIALSEE